MKNASIYIGTSGWKYKHWNNVFYPSDIKEKDQLNYYCELFETVELNNSFYRQPKEQNYLDWKSSVPNDFVFAVKANRYFTHLKKLKVEANDINTFLDRAAHLENKLGPILFQFPPTWKINIERLGNFLKLLPQNQEFAFEFRNTTWYHPEVDSLLRQYNIAFCIYELDGHLSPLTVTADFIYIRLHGPAGKYQGFYTDSDLEKWAEFAKDAVKDSKKVYIYFDNDQAGYAAFNAKRLKELIFTK